MTDVLKDIENLVEERIAIVNDPLNGCPDDFAEAYGRALYKLIEKAIEKDLSAEDIAAATIRGVQKAHASLSL